MFENSLSSTLDSIPLPQCPGVTAGHATHPGLLREVNEDSHAIAPDLGFFVVADGVGGSPAGAVASRLATAAMTTFLRYAVRAYAAYDGSPGAVAVEESAIKRAQLVSAAHQAHQMIYTHGLHHGCAGAATTMAALWVTGHRALIANTGDSRVYRLTPGGLEQLSHDHSALQEYIDNVAKGPVPESAQRALECFVTQVLGGHSDEPPEVRVVAHELEEGEMFLLCTDGLTKMVGEDEIAAVLGSEDAPQDAAERLVYLANEAGGADNITCVVVRVERRRVHA